jgi:hypothetical protein
MNTENIQKLGLWLSTKRHTQFEWGKNDCNTFVLEMHDHMHGTNYLKLIKEKYANKMGAARFAKRWPSAPAQLQTMGYKTGIRPTTGDVLAQNFGLYYTGWVVLGNEAYSMQEERGLVVAKTSAINDYTIWRM